MVDKNNTKSDSDIKKAMADVLRASDIIPPFDVPAERRPAQPPIPIEAIETTARNTNKPPVELRPDIDEEPVYTDLDETDVPEFDLAEQILSQHRKQTAIKRKSPAEKTEIDRVPLKTDTLIGQKTTLLPARYDSIIADIVARDIAKFCRR